MEWSEYTALASVNDGTMWRRRLQLTAAGVAVMTSAVRKVWGQEVIRRIERHVLLRLLLCRYLYSYNYADLVILK